ncbi:GNAT family N-acetyltransferase [Paenibacillus sp. Lou8.1]|uniref:GNAT family N-acetyltransferase n=1 Tax=Paenibacillus TaxID=44249 RepID=UPI0020B8E7E3|nr:GNAT family N-acetyltransferase [Paenibacillus sp. Lou8.1]MCP3810445.1 GNAT family N-acetyltransferase [Paenibacillus sp. Lou8.1]
MNNVEIRRPEIKDIEKLNELFRVVITDTFAKEGIGHMLEDIEEEINTKRLYLESDLESHGEQRYFLIAVDGNQIMGSIEYGPVSQLISKSTSDTFKKLCEVGTVFVHPDYQKIGVGNLLLKSMYLALKNRGVEEFCLDSGYRIAQKIWKKKFGTPDYLLKDYWGAGSDHMIWRIKVKDAIK